MQARWNPVFLWLAFQAFLHTELNIELDGPLALHDVRIMPIKPQNIYSQIH